MLQRVKNSPVDLSRNSNVGILVLSDTKSCVLNIALAKSEQNEHIYKGRYVHRHVT